MMIIGCDLHTRYQQIAMLDTETGEEVERRLEHENGEARVFYSALQGPIRVRIEATGYTHWFEGLLAERGHELWMGDAAKIRASVIRKQKTDARDAEHLLNLLRQIPDDDGNLIPPSVKDGSAEIAGPQGEYQRILIAVDAGIYNMQKATCTPICITCEGAVEGFIDANPFAVGVGGTTQETFTVQYKSGTQYNLTASASWGSSNATVATVTTGIVAGANAGTLDLTATSRQEINGEACSDDYHDLPTCPETTVSAPSTPGTVTNNTPILTGINPSDWPSGTTTPSVSFTGQYFGTNAPTLTFSLSSGIGYSLVSYNDTQIVANITVASGTPTEEVDVSVTNNGYGGLGFQSGGGRATPQLPQPGKCIRSLKDASAAWAKPEARPSTDEPSHGYGAPSNLIRPTEPPPTTLPSRCFPHITYT
jgi:hypothetical protein